MGDVRQAKPDPNLDRRESGLKAAGENLKKEGPWQLTQHRPLHLYWTELLGVAAYIWSQKPRCIRG